MDRLTSREIEALLNAITTYDNELEQDDHPRGNRYASQERAALERVMEKLIRPRLYPPQKLPASWKRSVT